MLNTAVYVVLAPAAVVLGRELTGVTLRVSSTPAVEANAGIGARLISNNEITPTHETNLSNRNFLGRILLAKLIIFVPFHGNNAYYYA
jgi:hypothetical protein